MNVYFKNPGLVEIRGLTTFGVNAKEIDSPIGYFGTGFKMATGLVLRSGGSVVVYRGLDRYEFFVRSEEVRGREFGIVHLRYPDGTEEPLGFTTGVAKNWKPWQAYREFRCNQSDEGGGLPTTVTTRPEEGTTLVVVEHPEILEAHLNSDQYFLNGEPYAELEGIHVHHTPEPDTRIFFRGIKVGDFQIPSMFTYNFQSGVLLTEDRTVANGYAMELALRRAIALSDNEEFLEKVLAPSTINCYEYKMDFSHVYSASETFLDVATRLIKQKPTTYNLTLRQILHRLRNVDPYESADPSVAEAKMLMKAEAICEKLGMPTRDVNIRVVDNLGQNVLGQAHGNNIFLSRRVFNMGTKMVAGTLYEEVLHAKLGLEDESRNMQNWLIDKIMSMVEDETGEPM